jgi:hypothetical protein
MDQETGARLQSLLLAQGIPGSGQFVQATDLFAPDRWAYDDIVLDSQRMYIADQLEVVWGERMNAVTGSDHFTWRRK